MIRSNYKDFAFLLAVFFVQTSYNNRYRLYPKPIMSPSIDSEIIPKDDKAHSKEFNELELSKKSREEFKRLFIHDECDQLWVPGRIEVVGKHTDYAKGKSIVCAIDRGFVFSYSFTSDNLIKFYSSTYSSVPTLIYDINDLDNSLATDANRSGYAKYISSTIHYIIKVKKWTLGGANISVCSNLPHSSGLSSSSAIVCGLSTILTKVAGKPPNSISIDELGGIESGDIVGTRGGTQDHVSRSFFT